jgi:Tol biopolymer transport system component
VPYYGHVVMLSPILALSNVITTITYGFLLVGVGVAIILASSVFTMLPVLPNQSAYGGTFPGPNGQIAFDSDRDNVGGEDALLFEIYVMNADGSGQTRLTNNAARDTDPSWSPDGEKIAFGSDRDNVIGGGSPEPLPEIYVMNADGSGQTRLTNNAASDTQPSWSPDGKKIAFSHDSYRIYVMNADGSGQTRLTNGPFDTQPSWSPDGTKIAFSRGFPLDIYVMNADGSGVTRLTENDRDDEFPSWSPDGKKIAFASNRDAFREIYVMNADGSGVTRLTENSKNHLDNRAPSWSPDGKKIAFGSDLRDPISNRIRTEIYVMNADGSGQTNLSNNPSSIDTNPDWGTATAIEDTTPPTLTVPEDIEVEATSEDGAQVMYTVTAQDNVDGNATLEEDGSTVTQDDIGGDIDISCEPASGTTFPIGNTTVQCSATDEAGNTGTASFMVTVNAPPPPEEDTTPPVLTVPEDMVVNATSEQGTEVMYNVSAEDNVDGTATLEEDGSITQDDVGGNITISCDPPSGSTFPIGETEVECSATDEAGNTATELFTVTVNPPTPFPPSTPIPKQVIDELISIIQNVDNVPQSIKTDIITLLEEVSNILTDNNPNNDESACDELSAFINEVNAAERSGTLTADQAADLRTQAEDIRNMLSC